MTRLIILGQVERPHIPVPVLVPGLQYKYHLDILCIDEDGSAEPVQVPCHLYLDADGWDDVQP